MEWFVLTLKNK